MVFVGLGTETVYVDGVLLVEDPHATFIMITQGSGRKECEITTLLLEDNFALTY